MYIKAVLHDLHTNIQYWPWLLALDILPCHPRKDVTQKVQTHSREYLSDRAAVVATKKKHRQGTHGHSRPDNTNTTVLYTDTPGSTYTEWVAKPHWKLSKFRPTTATQTCSCFYLQHILAQGTNARHNFSTINTTSTHSIATCTGFQHNNVHNIILTTWLRWSVTSLTSDTASHSTAYHTNRQWEHINRDT